MIKLLILCLTSLLMTAEPLTDTDKSHLKKRKITEHILYETYLETDKGLASVFGYQFDTYFNQNQCFILAISGAVNGDRGGYGFAAFGLGQTIPLHRLLSLNLRGFMGSGGGGGLPAGGGFMLEAHVGLVAHVTPAMGIELNTGFLTYPTGTFSSPMVNLGVSMSEYQVYLPWR
jgi:hypothetical protein